MPQLDKFIILSQLLQLYIVLYLIYFLVLSFLIPIIAQSIKLNKKLSEYYLQGTYSLNIEQEILHNKFNVMLSDWVTDISDLLIKEYNEINCIINDKMNCLLYFALIPSKKYLNSKYKLNNLLLLLKKE